MKRRPRAKGVGGGGQFCFFACPFLAFLPSVISSFFTQNGRGRGVGEVPPGF